MAGLLAFKISACCLACATAAANAIVCFVIITRPQLHRRTANWFVLSLALADVGAGLSALPHAFLCEPGVDLFCKGNAVLLVYWFFLVASVTNLCCMVTDRYIAVVWSLRYPTLVTQKRAVVAISSAWMTALVFVMLVLSKRYIPNSNTKHHYWKGITLFYAFFMVLLPCVYLTFTTVHMIVTARRLHRQRMTIVAQVNFNRHHEDSVAVIPDDRHARIRSSTIIVAIVVSCFVVCYFVEAGIFLCDGLGLYSPSVGLYFVYELLYVVNSLLNPIAYSLVKCDIKTELRRLCSANTGNQVSA